MLSCHRLYITHVGQEIFELFQVQCTKYNVQCTMYNVQCTMYIKLRLLLSWSCTQYSVHTVEFLIIWFNIISSISNLENFFLDKSTKLKKKNDTSSNFILCYSHNSDICRKMLIWHQINILIIQNSSKQFYFWWRYKLAYMDLFDYPNQS